MTKILLTGKRSVLFDSISPSPVVFSYGRNYKKREVKIEFLLISKEGVTKKLIFNRELYRSIKGPHHYKLTFYDYLRLPDQIRNKNYTKFVENYICKQKIDTFLAKNVNIYLNKELYKTHECK